MANMSALIIDADISDVVEKSTKWYWNVAIHINSSWLANNQ